MEHKLRPSNAPRWMQCPAAVHLVPTRPEQEIDPALEGTCAAWVAECVINGDASSCLDMLGETHANGWQVDERMVEHIQWYVDTVMAREGTHKAEFYIKHPIFDMGGTMDHIGWSPDFRICYIDDLKYGYDIVEPNSWQLVCYLFLLLANMPPDRWPEIVQMSILQPRGQHKDGPYRKLVIKIADIQPQLDRMQQQVEAITAGEDTAIPGPKCQNCRVAIGCQALTRSVYSLWEPIHHREYLDPTPAQLGEELAMLERMNEVINARTIAVKAEAEARLAEGGFVPGWANEPRYGKRKFTVDPVMIQMVTGIDPRDDGICTPAELIRRGAKKEVVATITTTPRIGSKLTRVDESSIAATVAAAKQGSK